MAEDEEIEDDIPAKRSKLPLLIGLVLAVVLGGAGFYVMYSGMLGGAGGDAHAAADEGHVVVPLEPDIAFVPIEPLVISLGRGATNRHLRFKAQLEVAGGYQSEVEHLMPRVLDVLNSYLRAVEVSDLEERSALIKLRAQMLRRIQLVTGEGRVRDLLVTEFVLN